MIDSIKHLVPTLFFTLGIVILFFTFSHKIKKGNPKQDKERENFLKLEHEASFCTKKVFPSSLLWTIDFDKIPSVAHSECEIAYEKLLRFKKLPLADLSTYSNLDLKREFGINHLDKLINAEQCYLECMNALTAYGVCLKEAGFISESINLLEYLLEKGCDKKDCYLSLIGLYVIIEDKQKLFALKERVNTCASSLLYLESIEKALDGALHLNL